MSSFEGLSIPIKAIDEATAVFKKVSDEAQTSFGNVEVATKKVTETQEKASLGMKDTVVAFSGVATSAFSLYNAYDNVVDMQVSVDKANLAVKSSLNSLEDAQKRYNTVVAKFGSDSAEAKSAQGDLALSQERCKVALERAEMVQGNYNETMVRSALSVIPSVITMVASLTAAKGAHITALFAEGGALSASSIAHGVHAAAAQVSAAAQWLLNAAMSANPIMLVVLAIAALVAIFVYAYNNCKPFREAVEALGKALVSGLKAAVDAVVGALTWFWNNVLSPIIGVLKQLWDVITGNPIIAALFGPITMIAYLIQHWDEVSRGLSGFLTGFWNTVLKPIGDFLSGVFASAVRIVTDVVVLLQAGWQAFSAALLTIWNAVVKPMSDFLTGVFASSVRIVTDVVKLLQGGWQAFSAALSTICRS